MPAAASLFSYLLSAALGVLGLVFVVGSQGLPARLVVGLILLLAAAALAALPRLRPQTIEVKQRIDLPGELSLKGLACTTCGASLTRDAITLVAGAVHVDCSHCGAAYQIEEAPSW